ncbi:ThuA domain-containing protein [Paenibacillus protaetiae]|uniref:ThuA-like domain-containing protein n=1 Tax=Paenibacillus protaetiae TaxID=2509456 RepID=A0A4P6EWG7_9BACL|nr:ThuA domain-containing protein [Paenibacillus protaetiae]QAY67056.1 hypothetical protein ET464_12265 [Paenibacillus protaetiae]
MGLRIGVLCDDEWHPAEIVKQGLAPLAGDGLQFEYSTHAREWSAAWMDRFDAVILAKSNRVSAEDRTPWLTEEVQAAFRDYVERGKGLLVLHAGTVGYKEEPLFRSLAGGVFRSHPAPGPVTLIPARGEAASLAARITGGMDRFVVHDEHYEMEADTDEADIFMHSESEHGIQPAGWMLRRGSGRVAVLTPGHYIGVWLHPSYQLLLKRVLLGFSSAGMNEHS